MANVTPVRWLWRVAFARWTSPGNETYTCNVAASAPEAAISLAWSVLESDWHDERSSLSVLEVKRVAPIHAVQGARDGD